MLVKISQTIGFLRSHMSYSVRVSGIKVNEWLQQSQEILSVVGLDCLRPKLQEHGNILILKQGDSSVK